MSYSNPSRMRLTPIASALLLAALSYVGPGQQTAHAQIPTELTALQNYVIAPSSLEDVLNRFARQAGLTLSFDPDMVANRQSQGLRGEYTVQGALERLLAGTGLSYRIGSAGTVTLVQVQDGNGPVRLGPILVGGEARGGPVEGFRAERSSTATNVDAPLIIWHPGDANAYVKMQRSYVQSVTHPPDAIYFDAATGQSLHSHETGPVLSAQRFLSGLHFILFDHWPLRWLYFVLGLSGCVMIATGAGLAVLAPMLNWVTTGRGSSAERSQKERQG